GNGLRPLLVQPATRAGSNLGGDPLERGPALGLGHAVLPSSPTPAGTLVRAEAGASQPRLATSSAISTAFVAAPLRRLSLTTQNAMPRSTDGSRRTRPTKTSSRPAAVVASG